MHYWEFPVHSFPIQWHLTIDCDKKCSHCYTTDPLTYRREKDNELELSDLLKVCDRIIEFKDKYHIQTPVSLTGGHPLLRKDDLMTVIKYLRKEDITVSLMGNRSKLEDFVNFFRNMKIRGYQLSLDGTKEIHESIRGKGSWNEVFEGITLLNENDIPSDIMFTVNTKNIHSLKEVCDACVNAKVQRFSFDRMVPLGSAKNLEGQFLESKDYHAFMYDIFQHYLKHVSNGSSTYLALKDQLWKPLLHELGIFKPKQRDKIISGCLVGVSGLTILTDGGVLPCRRLPIDIGKLPEESISDIFFENDKHNELRQFDAIEKCGECNLLFYCRGNRCVAMGKTGDYFSEDPQCWMGDKR